MKDGFALNWRVLYPCRLRSAYLPTYLPRQKPSGPEAERALHWAKEKPPSLGRSRLCRACVVSVVSVVLCCAPVAAKRPRSAGDDAMCDALRLSRSELGELLRKLVTGAYLGAYYVPNKACSALSLCRLPRTPSPHRKISSGPPPPPTRLSSAVLRRDYVGPSAPSLSGCGLLQRPYSTNHTRGLRCIRSALRYSVLAGGCKLASFLSLSFPRPQPQPLQLYSTVLYYSTLLYSHSLGHLVSRIQLNSHFCPLPLTLPLCRSAALPLSRPPTPTLSVETHTPHYGPPSLDDTSSPTDNVHLHCRIPIPGPRSHSRPVRFCRSTHRSTHRSTYRPYIAHVVIARDETRQPQPYRSLPLAAALYRFRPLCRSRSPVQRCLASERPKTPSPPTHPCSRSLPFPLLLPLLPLPLDHHLRLLESILRRHRKSLDWIPHPSPEARARLLNPISVHVATVAVPRIPSPSPCAPFSPHLRQPRHGATPYE